MPSSNSKMLGNSYGSKGSLPLPAPPAASSLRAVGALVAVSFVVSMLFMGVVIQSTGVGDSTPNQLLNEQPAVPSLRLVATQVDAPDLKILRQFQLQLSQDAEDVRVSIAFEHDTVTSGDYVPMKKAEAAPSVSIEGDSGNSVELFTYVLVDIDAPDPKAPTHAPFLHYILADLSVGEQSAKDQQQEEEVVVVPYYPVTPPVGEHRYVSLLFRQQGDNLDEEDTALTEKRSNFDVAGFATKHKLELVATNSFHSHPEVQDD